MTEEEKWKRRAQIHQLLDLCLDINGVQKSNQKYTGDHPTAFFRFAGHVGLVDIDVHPEGYDSFARTKNWNLFICEEDETEILNCIRDLESIKRGMKHEEME